MVYLGKYKDISGFPVPLLTLFVVLNQMSAVTEGLSTTKTKRFKVKHPKRKLYRCQSYKTFFVTEEDASVRAFVPPSQSWIIFAFNEGGGFVEHLSPTQASQVVT